MITRVFPVGTARPKSAIFYSAHAYESGPRG